MDKLGDVNLYWRNRKLDDRGWLLKVVSGDEENLEPGVQEVYVACVLPEKVRGHHYHRRTREWFTVLSGEARLDLEDPESGEKRTFLLSEEVPVTVEVAPGVAHAIAARGKSPVWLVAAASRPYDPEDTHAYRLDCQPPTGNPNE